MNSRGTGKKIRAGIWTHDLSNPCLQCPQHHNCDKQGRLYLIALRLSVCVHSLNFEATKQMQKWKVWDGGETERDRERKSKRLKITRTEAMRQKIAKISHNFSILSELYFTSLLSTIVLVRHCCVLTTMNYTFTYIRVIGFMSWPLRCNPWACIITPKLAKVHKLINVQGFFNNTDSLNVTILDIS